MISGMNTAGRDELVAETKLLAAKGELEAAKNEQQTAFSAFASATDEVTKAFRKQQLASCTTQVQSWTERVAELLKLISRLEQSLRLLRV